MQKFRDWTNKITANKPVNPGHNHQNNAAKQAALAINSASFSSTAPAIVNTVNEHGLNVSEDNHAANEVISPNNPIISISQWASGIINNKRVLNALSPTSNASTANSINPAHSSTVNNSNNPIVNRSPSLRAAASTFSTLDSAEQERLRKERHQQFKELLSDQQQFQSFLKFLTADQQQELLFICEINQLLDRSKDLDEMAIFTASIKIGNIFLRTENSPTNSSNISSPNLPALQSILPETRKHLQNVLPTRLPADFQGNVDYFTGLGSKYDITIILTMLEIARDQVEEGLSKKSLAKFVDFYQKRSSNGSLNQLEAENSDNLSTTSSNSQAEDLSHLLDEYEFEDIIDEPQLYRNFLLYLMEERRHRILAFWAQVQTMLILTTDLAADSAGNSNINNPSSPTRKHSRNESNQYNNSNNIIHNKFPHQAHLHNCRHFSRVIDYSSFSAAEFHHIYQLLLELFAKFQTENANLPRPAQNSMEINKIRANIAELINKVKPNQLKVEKILRLQFWPQFCKSILYSKAIQGINSVQNSGRKQRNALISQLKQQKVTREMLIVECQSEISHQNRHKALEKLSNSYSKVDNTINNVKDSHENCSGETQRLFEYVVVVRAAPPSLQHQSAASPIAQNLQKAVGSSNFVQQSSQRATSEPPSTPPFSFSNLFQNKRGVSGNNIDNSVSKAKLVGNSARNRALRVSSRYPAVDHSSSGLPNNVAELCFPMNNDVEALCSCSPIILPQQCSYLTTAATSLNHQFSIPLATASAVNSKFNPPSAAENNSVDNAAEIPPTDFYGFPIELEHRQEAELYSSNHPCRLFNFVVTVDGIQLYAACLQLSSTEELEEEEITEDEAHYSTEESRSSSSDQKVTARNAANSSAAVQVSNKVRKSSIVLPSISTALVGLTKVNETQPGQPFNLQSFIGDSLKSVKTELKGLIEDNSSSGTTAVSQNANNHVTLNAAANVSSPASMISGSGLFSAALAVSPAAAINSNHPSALAAGAGLSSLSLLSAYSATAQSANQPKGLSPAAPVTPIPPPALPVANPITFNPNHNSNNGIPSASPDYMQASSHNSAVDSPASIHLKFELHEVEKEQGLLDGVISRLQDEITAAEIAEVATAVLTADHDQLISSPPPPKIKRKVQRKICVQYAVCILSRYPNIQLLRDALQSLPITANINELIESPAFKRLLFFTHPPKLHIDMFGLKNSNLTTNISNSSLQPLFSCLHPRRVLSLVESLILERKILLISSQISLLTLLSEVLLSLLYPFQWKYLYVPLLPLQLFKYLSCPTPFLIGIHSCFFKKARDFIDKETIVVNLDNDEISVNITAANNLNAENQHFPAQIREILLQNMNKLFRNNHLQLDHPFVHSNPAASLPLNQGLFNTEKQANSGESISSNITEAGELVITPSPKLSFLSLDNSNSSALQTAPTYNSISTTASSASASASLLLRLEFLKLWSHLLKGYRNFCLYIYDAAEPSIIFDIPSFLSSKPLAYQPFLTALCATSYFPLFIFERSCGHGLETVQYDAFDRYEALLAGQTVHSRYFTGPESAENTEIFAQTDPAINNLAYLGAWQCDSAARIQFSEFCTLLPLDVFISSAFTAAELEEQRRKEQQRARIEQEAKEKAASEEKRRLERQALQRAEAAAARERLTQARNERLDQLNATKQQLEQRRIEKIKQIEAEASKQREVERQRKAALFLRAQQQQAELQRKLAEEKLAQLNNSVDNLLDDEGPKSNASSKNSTAAAANDASNSNKSNVAGGAVDFLDLSSFMDSPSVSSTHNDAVDLTLNQESLLEEIEIFDAETTEELP
jgi:hypothetical protein